VTRRHENMATVVNNPPKSNFTPEEEKRIQEALQEYAAREREAMVQAEIQNRIIEAQKNRRYPA